MSTQNESTATLAAASIDITPTRLLPLAGYANRQSETTGVNDRLELNGLLLRLGDTATMIMCADLLYVSHELKTRILQALRPVIALDDTAFLFAASHTHSAPAVDFTKPRLGPVDCAYLDFVVEQAIALGRQLAGTAGDPVSVSHGTIETTINVNRRRPGWRLSIEHPWPRRTIMMAPNQSGSRDPTVHLVMFFRPQDTAPVAILWSYACHPVAFPRRDRVSADFPGVVRSAFRAAYGPRLPVLYLQGFSGDVRPYAVSGPRSFRRRLKEFLVGPLFTPFYQDQYASWCEVLVACALGLARNIATGVHPVRPLAIRVEEPLSRFLNGNAIVGKVAFHNVRLTPALHILAVSAEPVADYVGIVRALGQDRHVITTGCIDSVFGYLPTAGVLAQGGYEAGGFAEEFGLEAAFQPEIEDVTRGAFERLLRAPSA